jgi:7-cyano-7-deazaguanine synthase
MKKDLAVVLISGGMDSCLTAAIAAAKYDCAFLHLNYGQKTEQRELKAFDDIADYYAVEERLVVDLHYFARIGGSSLTDSGIKVSQANLTSKRIPSSYVPFRNANILSIATSWAEVLGAAKIYIGAVEEDSSGYPDCREGFFKTFNRVIKVGTRPDTKIEIVTPLIHSTKKEIVEQAIKLKAPIHLTWSCYKNEDVACGVCDSCALRLRGFQQAGVADPIVYEKQPGYL